MMDHQNKEVEEEAAMIEMVKLENVEHILQEVTEEHIEVEAKMAMATKSELEVKEEPTVAEKEVREEPPSFGSFDDDKKRREQISLSVQK